MPASKNNDDGPSTNSNTPLLGLFEPPSSSEQQQQQQQDPETGRSGEQRPTLQHQLKNEDSFRVTGPQRRASSKDSVDEYRNENAGTLTHLQGLFQQQQGGQGEELTSADDSAPWHKRDNSIIYEEEGKAKEHPLQRKRTKKGSNTTSERTSLLQKSEETESKGDSSGLDDFFAPSNAPRDTYGTNARISGASHDSTENINDYSQKFTAKTPQTGHKTANQKEYDTKIEMSAAPEKEKRAKNTSISQKAADTFKIAVQEMTKSTTWIGAFVFLLYHVVFSLAAGSAIRRPHASTSILGLMTKSASVGIIFAG